MCLAVDPDYSVGLAYANKKPRRDRWDSNHSNPTPLVSACQAGLYDHVKLLLEYNASFDRTMQGETPLHMLCQRPSTENPARLLEAIKLLIDASAHPNAATASGLTPLHSLCKYNPNASGSSKAKKQKQKRNKRQKVANVGDNNDEDDDDDNNDGDGGGGGDDSAKASTNINDSTSSNVNDAAVLCDHDIDTVTGQIAELLIAHRADVNAQTTTGVTPLYNASCRGMSSVVRVLLESKANVNAKPSYSSTTALTRACAAGHESVALLLLNAKADVCCTHNPLVGASKHGLVRVVSQLVERRANVNLVGGEPPMTPLAAACSSASGIASVAPILLAASADINPPRAYSGVLPLQAAAAVGNFDIVQQLVESNALLEAKDNRGTTALHAASDVADNAAIVKFLLESGACANARDKDNATPLHRAAAKEGVTTLRVLLRHDANVNAANKSGNTPLWVAASNRAILNIRELLDVGADPRSAGCFDGGIAIVEPRILHEIFPDCTLFASLLQKMCESLSNTLLQHDRIRQLQLQQPIQDGLQQVTAPRRSTSSASFGSLRCFDRSSTHIPSLSFPTSCCSVSFGSCNEVPACITLLQSMNLDNTIQYIIAKNSDLLASFTLQHSAANPPVRAPPSYSPSREAQAQGIDQVLRSWASE